MLQKQEQTGEQTGMSTWFDFLTDQASGEQAVDNAWVYTHFGSPKNKEINCLHTNGQLINYQYYGYSHFEGPTKFMVQPSTLVLFWIVKIITKDIKNKSENKSV